MYMILKLITITSIFLSYLFNYNIAYSQTYPDNVTKDLARNCHNTHKINASNYNRKLDKKYEYYKAKKTNGPIYTGVAIITINIFDNYSEKHEVTCEFNSSAKVLCFSDPFDLSNTIMSNGEMAMRIKCWETPQ